MTLTDNRSLYNPVLPTQFATHSILIQCWVNLCLEQTKITQRKKMRSINLTKILIFLLIFVANTKWSLWITTLKVNANIGSVCQQTMYNKTSHIFPFSVYPCWFSNAIYRSLYMYESFFSHPLCSVGQISDGCKAEGWLVKFVGFGNVVMFPFYFYLIPCFDFMTLFNRENLLFNKSQLIVLQLEYKKDYVPLLLWFC